MLAHWNNSLRIDMLLHFDILSWFRANQSWLCVLNTACLAEKQQIPILSVVWPDMGLNPWSTALKASTLIITPPMLFQSMQKINIDTNIIYISLNYVSPSNEGRHIVLVGFFLPLLLLLSEDCPDHNFFVFRDRSMIFGMWVYDHKVVCRVP